MRSPQLTLLQLPRARAAPAEVVEEEKQYSSLFVVVVVVVVVVVEQKVERGVMVRTAIWTEQSDWPGSNSKGNINSISLFCDETNTATFAPTATQKHWNLSERFREDAP